MARFVKVADVGEVPPGTVKLVFVEGFPVALYNVEGQVYATDDTCTHDEASMSEGKLTGPVIKCYLHGAEYDVRTGKVLRMPAVAPLNTHAVKVEGKEIWVSLDGQGQGGGSL
ncbi:MAG: non-heme iron oxygenase ferredoxin subunit [Chloroflexi bacterium]|nr:non-heme iron oxygenase ferredoxin subunit [Chloroflexota bacterium]